MKTGDDVIPVSKKDGYWESKYFGTDGVVERDKLAYLGAKTYYHQVSSPDFIVAGFGRFETDMKSVVRDAREKYLLAMLSYASTLFAASGSLSAFLQGLKEECLTDLVAVLQDVSKLKVESFTPSQKEVLVACYMATSTLVSDYHLSMKTYREEMALKFARSALGDKEAPLPVLLLVRARMSLMEFLPEDERLEHRRIVEKNLTRVLRKPELIEGLRDIGKDPGDEWKTYVRLARMVFFWKAMFFGLRHDSSKDLRVKSLGWLVLNFWK